MNRRCRCGGLMQPYRNDFKSFARQCDRCGTIREQRKRIARRSAYSVGYSHGQQALLALSHRGGRLYDSARDNASYFKGYSDASTMRAILKSDKK